MSVRTQKYVQMRHVELNLYTKYANSSWFDQGVVAHYLGIKHFLNKVITLVVPRYCFIGKAHYFSSKPLTLVVMMIYL